MESDWYLTGKPKDPLFARTVTIVDHVSNEDFKS